MELGMASTGRVNPVKLRASTLKIAPMLRAKRQVGTSSMNNSADASLAITSRNISSNIAVNEPFIGNFITPYNSNSTRKPIRVKNKV